MISQGDSAMPKPSITAGQIKKIHVLKARLGLDDDVYRERLRALFGVESSTNLSLDQAATFIQGLIGHGADSEKRSGQRARNGYASPAQIAFIESLWAQISRARPDRQKKALRSFVARQAKVSDLRFLRDKDASKIICALKAMQGQAADNEQTKDTPEKKMEP